MVCHVQDNEFGGVDAGSISKEEVREGSGAAAADPIAGGLCAGCADRSLHPDWASLRNRNGGTQCHCLGTFCECVRPCSRSLQNIVAG